MNEKVYISGKISGMDKTEYVARFRKAEELLRLQGYHRIVNPVKFTVCRWKWLYKIIGYKLTLCYDLYRLMKCDRIYKIPGWKDSRGASVESYVAQVMRIRCIPNEIRDKIDNEMN